MNVKQLIEQLQQFDPEAMAVVAGYEGGHNEISDVGTILLYFNFIDDCYYVKHEIDNEGECHAICIG